MYVLVLKIWDGDTPEIITPQISEDCAISFNNSINKELFLTHNLKYDAIENARIKLVHIDGFETEVMYDSYNQNEATGGK